MTIILDACPSCETECVEVTASYSPPIPGTRLEPPERERFEDIRASCGCDLEQWPSVESALYESIGVRLA